MSLGHGRGQLGDLSTEMSVPSATPDPVTLRRQAQVMRLRETLDVAMDQRDAARAEASACRAREVALTTRLADRALLIGKLEVELARVRRQAVAGPGELESLRARAETLAAIEAGGWWRLRGRLLPVLRLARSLRALR